MPLRIYSIYYSLNNLIKPRNPKTTENAVYKIIILLNAFKSAQKSQEIYPKGM